MREMERDVMECYRFIIIPTPTSIETMRVALHLHHWKWEEDRIIGGHEGDGRTDGRTKKGSIIARFQKRGPPQPGAAAAAAKDF